MKKRKWTAESIAKMRATRAANRAAKAGEALANPPEHRNRDALNYLTHARRAQDKDYKDNLISLAIHTLRGTK